MIDILERKKLFEMLTRLEAGSKPVFGSMSAQHMVEHLAFVVRFSNGKAPQHHHYTPEKEAQNKAYVLGTDNDIPANFKSPVLPAEGLPVLKYPGLADAMESLENELNDFDQYFEKYPLEKPVNPTLGELNHAEWVRFHNRHFAHHFRQFGLKSSY